MMKRNKNKMIKKNRMDPIQIYSVNYAIKWSAKKGTWFATCSCMKERENLNVIFVAKALYNSVM